MANARSAILIVAAAGILAIMVWIVIQEKKKKPISPSPGPSPGAPPTPSPPTPPTPSTKCPTCPEGKSCILGNNQPYCDFPCKYQGPCSNVGALCTTSSGSVWQCNNLGATTEWGLTTGEGYPCTQAGYTVNKPWAKYLPSDPTCYAPAGQKCCNLDPVTNQCSANFSGYTANMMAGWATSCGAAPPMAQLYNPIYMGSEVEYF